MAAPTSAPKTLMDRLFLYGIRSLLIVIALVAFGVGLIIHGWLVYRLDYVASGAIIIMIGIGIGVALMRTSYTMITKTYFAENALVGKTGKAVGPMRAHQKGVVHIEHETWSSLAEEDIAGGDWIVVTGVEPDKVTLRVRKQPP